MTAVTAEALLVLSPQSFADLQPPHIAAAEAAGIRAGGGENIAMAFEMQPARRQVRITATLRGAPGNAMGAAFAAALSLHEQSQDAGARIESVRVIAGLPAGRTPAQRRAQAMQSAPIAAVGRGQRARPQTLMGEVSAPPAPSLGADAQRDAFRGFMTRNRLRPTEWAREAGVPVGEILGFLTGRSRGFSGEVAQKLAHAAKVRPEDLFR